MIAFNKKTKFDALNYDQLKDQAHLCTNCILAENRSQVVFGSGPTDADIMIIGEAPGKQEDEQGIPFVGRSGQLLTKILNSVGIDREKDVYIANTVKCRPPDNRTPTLPEISACQDFLIRQIQLIQPRILLLLGTPALKTILKLTDPISSVRGNWYTAEVAYMPDLLYIMPLFHPSYLLRHAAKTAGSPKWLTWKDVSEVKSALDYYRL